MSQSWALYFSPQTSLPIIVNDTLVLPNTYTKIEGSVLNSSPPLSWIPKLAADPVGCDVTRSAPSILLLHFDHTSPAAIISPWLCPIASWPAPQLPGGPPEQFLNLSTDHEILPHKPPQRLPITHGMKSTLISMPWETQQYQTLLHSPASLKPLPPPSFTPPLGLIFQTWQVSPHHQLLQLLIRPQKMLFSKPMPPYPMQDGSFSSFIAQSISSTKRIFLSTLLILTCPRFSYLFILYGLVSVA